MAPGAVIGAKVPRATCATPINTANTQTIAAASHRFGRRLPWVKAGWMVADIGARRGLRRALLPRPGAPSHPLGCGNRVTTPALIGDATPICNSGLPSGKGSLALWQQTALGCRVLHKGEGRLNR